MSRLRQVWDRKELSSSFLSASASCAEAAYGFIEPDDGFDPEQTIPHRPQSDHSTLQIGMDPLVAEAIVDVTNTYSRQFQGTDGANDVVPGFAEFL
jgi:hypothetical protein